jgi:hypothetical protein
MGIVGELIPRSSPRHVFFEKPVAYCPDHALNPINPAWAGSRRRTAKFTGYDGGFPTQQCHSGLGWK